MKLIDRWLTMCHPKGFEDDSRSALMWDNLRLGLGVELPSNWMFTVKFLDVYVYRQYPPGYA